MSIKPAARTGATWLRVTTARLRATTASLGATGGGGAAALILVGAAVAVPALTGWDVKALSLPPLFAEFRPRLGPGSAFAVLVAVAVGVWGLQLSRRVPWALLLTLTGFTSVVWMLSLDAIDGFTHLGTVLDTAGEYLPGARAIAAPGFLTGAANLLPDYVERIPLHSPDNLPVHLAGHPPGAVLFFALLISAGVKSPVGIGLIVTVIAATIPAAVLCTCRNLGAEAAARSIAPVLATAPAAIWLAVSADAVYAAVGAWGIAALSRSVCAGHPTHATVTARDSGLGEPTERIGLGRGGTASARVWAVIAGLLFGVGTYMSYGFPLLGFVVLAVLVVARNLRALPWAIGGALLVVALFTLGGFSWWEAYPVLKQRYWDGFASSRPAAYWMWANFAALVCATGPAVGAGLAEVVRSAMARCTGARSVVVRSAVARPRHAVVLLSLAALAMVCAADLSNMSRAEVERIWLFMVPWLLVSAAAVPARAQQRALALNLAFGLGLAHIALSAW